MMINLISITQELKKHFENRAELIISQDDINIRVRIRVISSKGYHNYSFLIMQEEMNETHKDIIDFKFDTAIKKLIQKIKEQE